MTLFSPETRQRSIGVATIAFAIGALASALLGVFWSTGHPGIIQINQITVSKLADGGHELAVDIQAPIEPGCLRMAEHLLYTTSPTEGYSGGGNMETGRIYLPIGATVTGSAFLPANRNFKLLLKVHPDTAYGKWNYVVRVVFLCSAFPGLLRLKEWESVPFPIQLEQNNP